ncbi:GNAT family N-acetyltransferase [bacterium SCSIO 12741]|nr:GNAT family N-acetyltransferase [bacterium SCSIO 12741]
MTVKNLSSSSIDNILDCFLEAFENYFVSLPTDKAFYKQRWKAAGVNFDCSYGMFDGEKLVGFIIHAIDRRNGKLTAFNTGTGVIPAYRGQRIVASIYTHALKDLAQQGIEHSVLEVITKNEIAIKLYEAIGFKKCKEFQCFQGTIDLDYPIEPELKEVPLSEVKWDHLPHQEFYSWDNQKESIVKGNYRFFEVIHKGKVESFFIINPALHYLSQLDLLSTDHEAWNRLFKGIQHFSDTMKVNNVDTRLTDKKAALLAIGLTNTVDQYEMEMEIKL